MSYADEIRRRLYTDTEEPVRAAIYARVSTDNEGQKESCANQVALANSFVTRHPNISVVGVYIDDGISAKNDFTRPEYNKMLEQITSGNVDIIIVKALSRLNRNDTTSAILKELCISTNTTILTLEDNTIQDFDDPNSEMMYGFKPIMDAQYVRRQSINGKKTHELRCERKELTAKDCAYGYIWNKEDKTIIIKEEQAEVVRRIFEEYVYRNGTPSSIQRALKAEGINICGRTVSNIIEDERYIGKFYINKRTTKLGTGRTKSKRIKLPKEQWVLCERPDLQIVDTDLFKMAQRIHRTRITVYEKTDKTATQARFQGTHLYAGKIFCPVCGKPYHFGYSDRAKTKPIYEIKGHSDCPNPVKRIAEPYLEEITRQALKQTIGQQNGIYQTLEAVLIECVQANKLSVSDKIAEIKSAIAELRNFTVIDRDRILNYVERIELPANGDVNILLKTGQKFSITATV